MEAYWNKLVLDRPPTTSWRCSSNQFGAQGFLKAINKSITELERQKILHTEAAILSRLIYRMKSKLRSDKGLKNMEKVNRALLNYLKLSLENDYKYLKDNTDCQEDILALPSRQMLQYVLARTQGFAKLMCRIENVAKCAGDFFNARINLGQAWNISVVAYAVISRIWLLSRYLTKKSCDWYSRMYKYLNKLTMVGVAWLPEHYHLPKDLKEWLDVPWIDEEIKYLSEKETVTDSIFNLITRDKEADEDLEIDLDETKDTLVSTPLVKSEEIDKKMIQSQIDSPATPLMEIGERISRDVFAADLAKQTAKIPRTQKRKNIETLDKDEIVAIPSKPNSKIAKKLSDKKPKKSKVLSVDDLETKEDVEKFLTLKSYPGLDKIQWKMLRKNVSKLLLKLKKYDDRSGTKKQEIVLKKAIRALREWIN